MEGDASNRPPPQRSADGSWWWDGQTWTRAAGAAVGDRPEPIIGRLQETGHSPIPKYRPPSELTGIPDPPEPLPPVPPAPPPASEDATWSTEPAFAARGQPTTQGGRGHGLAWRTIALVLAAILVAVPLAYFTAGALNVGADLTLAQRALQSGAGHTNQIADSFKGPNVPSHLDATTRQYIQTVRQVLTDYASSLSDVGSRLDSDMAALRFVDDSLKSDSVNPLLWRDKSELADEQRRVEALLAGLKSARSGIQIIQGQLPAFVALFEVFDGMETLIPYLDRQDVNGALAHYSTLDQSMQALVASTSGSNFSPQFVIAVSHLKAMTDDMKQLLEAVQYRNAAAVQILVPKVKADANAMSSDDLSDMGPFEQKLLLPYIDGYNSGVKAAGFNQMIDPMNL
jgi:hypothetical protein